MCMYTIKRMLVQDEYSSAVSSVTFDHHTMAMVGTETSIVWIIYAPTLYLTLPLCQERALSCLRSIDNLFRIMHQSLSAMIISQGYIATRTALKSFLFKFMPGFCKRDGWCTLHDLYSPMTPHRGLPFIPLKDPCFQGNNFTTKILVSREPSLRSVCVILCLNVDTWHPMLQIANCACRPTVPHGCAFSHLRSPQPRHSWLHGHIQRDTPA